MPAPSERHRGAVRVWLLSVAALIFAMVLVGGATRLTESGLSIVEWRPVTGALPPLSETAWAAEFEKYKAIPQYQTVNRHMSLEQFKTIYWWEWTHRLLGRVIGAAFLLPFLWFLWKGWIAPALRPRLWFLFGLGALQGAVGWWMVASGLTERVSVSPYRLAFHLTLACLIYAAIIWIVRRQFASDPAPAAVPSRLRIGALTLLGLVFLQLYVGGLLAGLDAGQVYNTWPLIDGSLVPSAERLMFLSPVWRNLFENELTVQFAHRMIACAIVAVALLHAANAVRRQGGRALLPGAAALAALVAAQAGIGIATLLGQAAIGLALAHQAMAMVVLTAAVIHAARATPVAQTLAALGSDPGLTRQAG